MNRTFSILVAASILCGLSEGQDVETSFNDTAVITDSPATIITSSIHPAKFLPTFSMLSFTAGMFVMLVFVLAPVGLMGYRNRNSIVEFIKNR